LAPIRFGSSVRFGFTRAGVGAGASLLSVEIFQD
jgi:hypothetical protein